MSIELSVIKQSKGGEARRREKEEKLITLSMAIMRSIGAKENKHVLNLFVMRGV